MPGQFLQVCCLQKMKKGDVRVFILRNPQNTMEKNKKLQLINIWERSLRGIIKKYI